MKEHVKKTYFEQLIEKDRWLATELGLKISPERSDYVLTFTRIKPDWLKMAAKKFLYLQASTKTYNTCRNYLKALVSFGLFISDVNSNIKPENIDRNLMVDYIHELCAVRQLNAETARKYLSNINKFFEINRRETWLNMSQETLIFNEDYPHGSVSLPKFIPEGVLQQLLNHLPSLAETDQRLIVLFLETGRRCGEIFTLQYHCLQRDNAGDYFLKVEDRKMKNSLLIPISENCVQHIKKQQSYVDTLTTSKDFLFVVKDEDVIRPMKSGSVCCRLNMLAKNKNILDDNGCLWHFNFHQFRHTLATRMINHGVTHHIVQRFLGHVSPEMTARYAAIHDSTLKEEFIKFQKRLSQPQKENVLKEVLSDPGALSDYQRQLENIKKCVALAKTKGWRETLTKNLKKQEELEKIIAIIKRGNIDAKSEA